MWKLQKAIRTHCKGVSEMDIPSKGGVQCMKIIPEGDIYRLIVRSKLPSAEKFEKWVFDEVIPSIRTNGGYIAGQETLSDEDLMAKAILVAQKKSKSATRLLNSRKLKSNRIDRRQSLQMRYLQVTHQFLSETWRNLSARTDTR